MVFLMRVAMSCAVAATTALALTPTASATSAAEFTLTSPAFADNEMIPEEYTCAGDGEAGEDPSPPLEWTEATDAQSYAIVFADRVDDGNKRHWAIWDIPAATLSLPENLPAGFEVPDQGGAKQKSFGDGDAAEQYFGPCPGGSTNPYTFTLYAVDTTTVPELTSDSSMEEIETAIQEVGVDETVLRGMSDAST